MIMSSICVRSSAFILPSPLTSALEVTGSSIIIILSTLVKSVLFTIPSPLASPVIDVGVAVGVGVGVDVGVGVGVSVGVGVGVGCTPFTMSKIVFLRFPEQCGSLRLEQAGQLFSKIDFSGDAVKSVANHPMCGTPTDCAISAVCFIAAGVRESYQESALFEAHTIQ